MEKLVEFLSLRIQAMENKIAEQEDTIKWQSTKINQIIKNK